MTDLHKTIEPVAWTVVGDGKFGKYKIGAAFTKLGANYWKSRGYELVPLYASPPSLDALIAEAVAKEREACALVCETLWNTHTNGMATEEEAYGEQCAAAIRARGPK